MPHMRTTISLILEYRPAFAVERHIFHAWCFFVAWGLVYNRDVQRIKDYSYATFRARDVLEMAVAANDLYPGRAAVWTIYVQFKIPLAKSINAQFRNAAHFQCLLARYAGPEQYDIDFLNIYNLSRIGGADMT